MGTATATGSVITHLAAQRRTARPVTTSLKPTRLARRLRRRRRARPGGAAGYTRCGGGDGGRCGGGVVRVW